jgi:hypothetical protein
MQMPLNLNRCEPGPAEPRQLWGMEENTGQDRTGQERVAEMCRGGGRMVMSVRKPLVRPLRTYLLGWYTRVIIIFEAQNPNFLTSKHFPINALLSDFESKETMASLLLRPLLRPQTLGLGLGVSLVTYHTIHQRPIRLDSGPILSGDSYRRNAQVPVVRNGHLNPGAVRQISSGSIIGMLSSSQ